MKLGLSPALAIILLGCSAATETTASTPTAPRCNVEVKIETDGARPVLTDLGPAACSEPRRAIIAEREGSSYLIGLSLDGPRLVPILSTSVARMTDGADAEAATQTFFHLFPLPGSAPTLDPNAVRTPIKPGRWVEVFATDDARSQRSRVLVRVAYAEKT